MRIGLIDVDGKGYPNLATMRISAFHKSEGDTVEWWREDGSYDAVYMSKVFSDTYSKDRPDPVNTDCVIRGGTGYAIDTINGVEVFRDDKHEDLPDYIETMRPDYSLYPGLKFAVAMTTRGCPRCCQFCIVGCKEGLESKQVAEPADFYEGQAQIQVMDPNLLACPDKHRILKQYQALGAQIVFNQGLDIRCMDDEDIDIINTMRFRKDSDIHMAWDNPNENLEPLFRRYANRFRMKRKGMVCCLTNYGSTIEQDLHRIYTLRDLGFDPYVMVYNKPGAPKEVRRLQRWCNNKIIFKTCPKFEDYKATKEE